MKHPATSDERYTKCLEVWRLLFDVEQLIINDPDYEYIQNSISNCLDIVNTMQNRLETKQ
jgi:hypothetical protein